MRRVAIRLAVAAALLAALASCAVAPKPVATSTTVVDSPTSGPASVPGSFAENPIVYFAITDRFDNGNPANDHAYGRTREATPEADVATFHGGDLAGVTKKLREGWFKQLGVNAIWITAPYEQIHGWVVGGDKAFKHYAYHGYFALDYTVLDKNIGTPEELREMVDTAHAQGIRILFDVVMNHPGYLDIQTANDIGVKVIWPGFEKATLKNYHSFIDYNNFAFGDWWGREWVRAGLPGYLEAGTDDLTKNLAFLPDFRTENPQPVKLPKFLREKRDTQAVDLPGTTVRGYLVTWLSHWVREYGIDGFRADTVRHVEPAAWAELKRASTQALADWKQTNPTKKIDDAAFWMTGEYWGQGPERSALNDSGFDSMINFDFQPRVKQSAASPENLFADYAKLMGSPAQSGNMPLNYISSHDTELFDRARLMQAGAVLMLAPGAPQIYYGDETSRPPGPMPASDPQQATRSDMNWSSIDQPMLDHWRKLGSFRARHVALARGAHRMIGASAPYRFSRIDAVSGDRVVVAMLGGDGGGPIALDLGGTFAEGEALRDAYGGGKGRVTGGKINLASAQACVLLERDPAFSK